MNGVMDLVARRPKNRIYFPIDHLPRLLGALNVLLHAEISFFVPIISLFLVVTFPPFTGIGELPDVSTIKPTRST